MAKTKTSSKVKRRYNNKVYDRLYVYLPKDMVARFKQKCLDDGVSQASVVRAALEKFIAE